MAKLKICDQAIDWPVDPAFCGRIINMLFKDTGEVRQDISFWGVLLKKSFKVRLERRGGSPGNWVCLKGPSQFLMLALFP